MLGLLDAFDDVLVKPFMPDGSVITLEICVLLGPARLDMLDLDVPLLGPFKKLLTDLFWAVVHPYALRLAPPFDDPVKAPDDPVC